MTSTSPRLDPRLIAAAFALDEDAASAAETWRRVGTVAEQLGLPRPGYDTIRRLLRSERSRRAAIRRLVDPIGVDLARGYVSLSHLDRIRAAAEIAQSPRDHHR